MRTFAVVLLVVGGLAGLALQPAQGQDGGDTQQRSLLSGPQPQAGYQRQNHHHQQQQHGERGPQGGQQQQLAGGPLA